MSDSDDDDNIIRFGTPLEPIDEDEIPSKRKFQKESSDQFALDGEGRRRFHGAFTGGFSAGFGNSVATPEGFTPATFKSTRSEKAQKSNQRPEDFMDEEDRGEFGIAPRLVQTNSDFSGQKRRRQTRYHDGPIPGEPVLEQLIRTVHETAAVRLLKAMGWKPGQGAGVRVSKKEKKDERQRKKVYGCYMPEELRQKDPQPEPQDTDSSDSEFEYDSLFAPDDYEPYLLRTKSDRFGLGYQALSRHNVLGSLVGEYGGSGSTSHLQMKDKGKKLSIRGQAFGVGALEEDDEDIYATEDMSHYDFSLGGPKVDEKAKKKGKTSTGVLPGFARASRPQPPPPARPAPALPRDYTPACVTTRFQSTDVVPRDQGLGRHELSAAARGSLLGEAPVPKPVEELPGRNEPAAPPKDPIAELLGRNVNFVSTGESSEKKELDFIPISGGTSDKVPKVFKPFASNPEKQSRYEKYLADKSSVLERDSSMDRMAAWERDRERLEFQQAAKLYKPLTGFMNDRFTHASQPDEQPTNPLAAVARSNSNRGLATQEQIDAAAKGLFGVMTRRKSEWRPEPLVCKRFNVPHPSHVASVEPQKDEKSKVSYSIFNYLETSVHDKASFAKEQSTFSGTNSQAEEITKEAPKVTPTNSRWDKPSTETPKPVPEISNKRMTVAELFMKEAEKELQNTRNKDTVAVDETINKFDKMELYKSIFLSDSEDDEAREETNKSDEKEVDFRDTPKNIERNTSPPRGIFANIDFDELNSWTKTPTPEVSKKETDVTPSTTKNNNMAATKEQIHNDVGESSLYGPKIPENLQKRLEGKSESTEIEVNSFKPSFRSKNERLEGKLNSTDRETNSFKPSFRSKSERDNTIQVDSSSSSDSWVEEKEVKSKKVKKKKSKKHKHKKSKHKKKNK
ncbi:G patch domain-containing protein 1 homolog isoform X1 [Plutella xylostella]|uniref:G patch domain-containing protein 1 homolog isoform X1 n=1 Tax=Plutella xylostella TaxID=51655 RepID=UPI00203273B1|nr:G patch domain-containing protein 1 homolog isoform X1 [Plutella xylostella]